MNMRALTLHPPRPTFMHSRLKQKANFSVFCRQKGCLVGALFVEIMSMLQANAPKALIGKSGQIQNRFGYSLRLVTPNWSFSPKALPQPALLVLPIQHTRKGPGSSTGARFRFVRKKIADKTDCLIAYIQNELLRVCFFFLILKVCRLRA